MNTFANGGGTGGTRGGGGGGGRGTRSEHQSTRKPLYKASYSGTSI